MNFKKNIQINIYISISYKKNIKIIIIYLIKYNYSEKLKKFNILKKKIKK